MKKAYSHQRSSRWAWILALIFGFGMTGWSQTVIPNASFEDWVDFGGYSNPQFWDSPNEETSSIPFIGFSTVARSTDHHAGTYSAKLETKHLSLPPTDIPGFLTLGNCSGDIATGTYTVTGGVPVIDMPTHLKGYFKFLPQGGDSCLIAIGLFKWNGSASDTIAGGYFSVKTAVPDWTPFSAWIDYDTLIQPDTMNIFIVSTAQEDVLTPGTTLYVDELWLDYTVGVAGCDPSAGVQFYQDRETDRILIFFDLGELENIVVSLYDMKGNKVRSQAPVVMRSGRQTLACAGLSPGIYLAEVLHGNHRTIKKFFIQ